MLITYHLIFYLLAIIDYKVFTYNIFKHAIKTFYQINKLVLYKNICLVLISNANIVKIEIQLKIMN